MLFVQRRDVDSGAGAVEPLEQGAALRKKLLALLADVPEELGGLPAARQRELRTLRRFREAEEALPAPELEHGGSVPYLGRELFLRVSVEPGRVRDHVARRGDVLHVKVGRAGQGHVRTALERWYRKRARVEVAARLDGSTRRAGTHYTRLTIRSQRTRWASCSSNGAMSFNWRLLLAPEPILDYVVEHEVAHLEVLDHSPRFWRLLGSRCPEYREHERWLKRHGAALRL